MPENYQAILDDLGVDTSNEVNTESSTPSDTVDTAGTADNTVENTTEVNQETTAEPEQDPVEDVKQRRSNEAFAAMRSENTKYKNFMQHLMKGVNYQGSEDDFIEKMIEQSYQKQAQIQGNQVSPELLKRLDSIETQNRNLIEERNRNMFASNIRNLQDKLGLNDKDIKEFVDLAVQEQIDLTIPGTNFVTLYQGLFFDKLKNRMLEDERQKWIAQNSKSNSAANPDGKSGKKDPVPTDVNTMAEFESLLKSVPNK